MTKLVIFTPLKHYYSPLVLRALSKIKNVEIVGIFVTPEFKGHKSLANRVYRILESKGIYFLFSMVLLRIYIMLCNFIEKNITRKKTQERRYLTVNEICQKNNWPVFKSLDVNSKDTIALIKKINPDVIISVFFNQFIGNELMNNYDCIINTHPSFLPYYRGIIPVFQVLANNEKTTGVSFHYVNAGIDEGDIILRKAVNISNNDTFHSLYIKCALAAEGMISEVLIKVKDKSDRIVQDLAGGSCYLQFDKATIRKFKDNNHSFLFF